MSIPPPSSGPQLPFHVMTKPVGPVCNLACTYCFYLEKEGLYPANQPFRMTDEVLESYIRQYIEQQPTNTVSFAWQGGEPTLLGVEYFRNVVALQRRHSGGKRIENALQTNGTLLDDAWGQFLKENNFLVGLSVDGPRALHDAYRVDKRQRPTFDLVMQGLRVLKKHAVDFNTLTVVNRKNSRQPLEVYRFLKEIGSGFIQFIPLVERKSGPTRRLAGFRLAEPPQPGTDDTAPVTPWSVEPPAYGAFLTAIFDEWVRKDVGRVFVQLFDVALGNWMNQGSSLCVFSETCGHALALEHNGDLYACDHFVYPEYKRGNLLEQSLGDMVRSPQQQKFGRDKSDTLPGYCRKCAVRFACHGECPKHRFLRTPDGEPGLNYLCAGYKAFFTHIDPHMQYMASLVRQGHPADGIMTAIKNGLLK